MIRREENGRFLLITQNDHATLSGALARLIGNDRFAPLTTTDAHRGERAIVAIARHDTGWDMHDESPTLNARMQPRDVFESKYELAIKLWDASARRAAGIDPYVGLLVSLHGLALSQYSLTEVMRHFTRQNFAYTRERFELNRFQHNEIERQAACRAAVGLPAKFPLNHGIAELGQDAGEDLLAFHFRALQAMDRLSLNLCCTKPPFETIELAGTPGQAITKIRFRRLGMREAALSPWPFSTEAIPLAVPAKSLPQRTYVGDADFHADYAAAPAESIEFHLRPDAA